MSSIWFCGDLHGKIKQYRKFIRGLPEGAKSIALGDIGAGFKGVYLYPGGCMAKGWHKIIRGNHDSPQVIRKWPMYLGDYGYLPEERLFYLGGAWSIDQQWRTEGISWWPDEELSYEDLDKAYRLYVQSKPLIVATHEAPSKAAWSMLAYLTGNVPHHDYSPTDQDVRVKGDEYEYYKAKLGCVSTRTSQALQRMFEEWQPVWWVFAHYHLSRSFTLGKTKFHCCNELETFEIDEKSLLEVQDRTNSR